MPSEVRYTDVKKLLESNGWVHDRTNGSHHIFVGEGRPPVSVPVHKGKVKFGHVRRIKKLIQGLEEEGE